MIWEGDGWPGVRSPVYTAAHFVLAISATLCLIAGASAPSLVAATSTAPSYRYDLASKDSPARLSLPSPGLAGDTSGHTGSTTLVVGSPAATAAVVAAEAGGTVAKFDPDFAVSQGEAAIKTPYGAAVQSPSAAAASLQSEAAGGATLYRAGEFGIQETEAGQFWSPKNPLLTPGYSEGFGTPGNAIDWVMGGEVDGPFITREAPGFGANPGGEPEVVTNPFGMRNLWFHMP